MIDYLIEIWSENTILAQISGAKIIKVGFKRNDFKSAYFEYNANNQVSELGNIIVDGNEVRIFRMKSEETEFKLVYTGEIMKVSRVIDDKNEKTWQVTIDAKPSIFLNKRILDGVFTSTEESTIAWGVIDYIQNNTLGGLLTADQVDWGITQGVLEVTSNVRDRTYVQQLPLKVLQQLADAEDLSGNPTRIRGFRLTPDLVDNSYHVFSYYANYGTLRSIIYTNILIKTITELGDNSVYNNQLIGIGRNQIQSSVVDVASVTTRLKLRQDFVSKSNIETYDALTQATTEELRVRLNYPKVYKIELSENDPFTGYYQTGDMIKIQYNDDEDFISLDNYFVVLEIDIQFDDKKIERTSLVIAESKPLFTTSLTPQDKLVNNINDSQTRIINLEKNQGVNDTATIPWGNIVGDIASQIDLNARFLNVNQSTPQITIGTFTFPIVSSGHYTSTVAIGTQPYATTSTTLNVNLNADLLDGLDSTAFALAGSLSAYVLKAGDTMLGNFSLGSFGLKDTNVTTAIKLGDVSNTSFSTTNKTIVGAINELFSGKVDGNIAITGATKTKITYDTKGLVTAGADATTADIADSTNKRYVTDAQLVVIGNTSGTNTGDQIVPVNTPAVTSNFFTAYNSSTGVFSKAQPTPTDVGLSNVTNDIQIKASIGTTKGDLITFSGSGVPIRFGSGASAGLLKTDGSGNWSIDTSTYLTSLSGALLATGATTGATSSSQVFTNGATLSNITLGSVLFAGTAGLLSQDNSNFFWDATNHRLGLVTTAPTHTITLSNTATGLSSYNTADQTTNFERVLFSWSSNIFVITTGAGGTGTQRTLRIGTNSRKIDIVDTPTASGCYQFNVSSSTTTWAGVVVTGSGSGASGVVTSMLISPTHTQSGTAGYIALRVNVTETGTGSGSKLLLDLAVGGTSKITVDNAGNITHADAANIILGTTTGSKIGTATSQKLGFWNATPIVQPTTAIAASTFAANTSGIVNDTATWDSYTIGQVVKALRNAGILA